ncbi:MAG: Ig-like domain-containing protein [Thermoplasmatota archaeon]
MKKKIIGILVGMLLISTCLGVASAFSTTKNQMVSLDAEIQIVKPNAGVYIFNMQIAPLPSQGRFNAIVIGMVDVELDILNPDIDKVEFYVDNQLKETLTEEPYNWTWNERMIVPPIHNLKVIGYEGDTEIGSDEIHLLYVNPFSRP